MRRANVIASPMLLAPIKARASTIKRPEMMEILTDVHRRVFSG
jgi:hypothetical protein